MLNIIARKPVSPFLAERRANRIATVRRIFEKECECCSACITDDEVLRIYDKCIDYGCAFDLMVEDMAALWDAKRCQALDTAH